MLRPSLLAAALLLLAATAGALPGTTSTLARGVASDGFVIEVAWGTDAALYGQAVPDAGPFGLADDMLHDALAHYEDYLALGMMPRWSEPVGHVYLDSADAQACGGCASGGAGRMVVHMAYWAPEYTRAIGDDAPSRASSYRNTLGHEMFHAFQGALRTMSDGEHGHLALREGTARLSETLHATSVEQHHPESFLHAQDKEGCNGYDAYAGDLGVFVGDSPLLSDMDRGMALGPFGGRGTSYPEAVGDLPLLDWRYAFPDRTYDACYFWLAWYGAHGPAGLVRLLEAQGLVDDANAFVELRATVEAATGEPIERDLVRLAQASLTGRGYVWDPARADAPALDWGAHLDRWTPSPLATGARASATLQDGGMMARELTASGVAHVEGGASMWLVVDDGASAYSRAVPDGSFVSLPPEARAWLVAIWPEAGAQQVAIALS